MSMKTKLTPFRIQKYLAGMRYPAQRDAIVRRALEKGADDRVLGALRALPDRWYPSPVALSAVIGHPEHSLRPLKAEDDAHAQDSQPHLARCA